MLLSYRLKVDFLLGHGDHRITSHIGWSMGTGTEIQLSPLYGLYFLPPLLS